MPYAYRAGDNYRAGDYYHGDYYRGDPGIFGALKKGFGSLIRGAARLAYTGFVTGNPLGAAGAIAGRAGLLGKAGTALSQPLIDESFGAPPAALPPPPGMGLVPFTGPPVAMMAGGGGAMIPRGYHFNKSEYARGGRLHSRGNLEIVLPHTTLVKNRRMNWANGRALSRAERRIRAFVHHATRYIRWVHPGKKGRAAPKFAKKRRK